MKHSSKVKLIEKTYTVDSIGQRVPQDILHEVWCDVKSISAKEFANGNLIGIKPDYVISIWQNEYHNEAECIYQDIYYSIYRTYLKDDGRIELYVEKRVGG